MLEEMMPLMSGICQQHVLAICNVLPLIWLLMSKLTTLCQCYHYKYYYYRLELDLQCY
jgi:hypothetical protein